MLEIRSKNIAETLQYPHPVSNTSVPNASKHIDICFSGESVHAVGTAQVRGRPPVPLLRPRHRRQHYRRSR